MAAYQVTDGKEISTGLLSASEVGMHLVGWLPPGKDDQRAAQLAAQIGIQILPIST
ncbi:MAG TPA: hypothetical protein VGT44_15340 [Ktedonobacteraceae bacterium]|nr:hypothetical protein [Ktedonobacteraceae bacterium]